MLDTPFTVVEGTRVQIKSFDIILITITPQFDKSVLLHVLKGNRLLHIHFELQELH